MRKYWAGFTDDAATGMRSIIEAGAVDDGDPDRVNTALQVVIVAVTAPPVCPHSQMGGALRHVRASAPSPN